MVFLVWVVPHGVLPTFIGIFSTEEKAERAKKVWIAQFPASHYTPIIEEFELDKIYAQPREGEQ